MCANRTVMTGQRPPAGESRRLVSLGFDAEPYPAGTHMCYIFTDEQERLRLIAQFVQSGLDANELVGCFVDTVTPAAFNESMRELGVRLSDELVSRQYSALESDSAYCPDGTFQVERMLDAVAGAHYRGIRAGFVGARVTGEMTWARKGYPGSEDLLEYEARVSLLLRTVPTTAICQYDARRFDGATLYGVLSVHPMMVVHGQVLQNPYFIAPEVFLAGTRAGFRD